MPRGALIQCPQLNLVASGPKKYLQTKKLFWKKFYQLVLVTQNLQNAWWWHEPMVTIVTRYGILSSSWPWLPWPTWSLTWPTWLPALPNLALVDLVTNLTKLSLQSTVVDSANIDPGREVDEDTSCYSSASRSKDSFNPHMYFRFTHKILAS